MFGKVASRSALPCRETPRLVTSGPRQYGNRGQRPGQAPAMPPYRARRHASRSPGVKLTANLVPTSNARAEVDTFNQRKESISLQPLQLPACRTIRFANGRNGMPVVARDWASGQKLMRRSIRRLNRYAIRRGLLAAYCLRACCIVTKKWSATEMTMSVWLSPLAARSPSATASAKPASHGMRRSSCRLTLLEAPGHASGSLFSRSA